MLRSDKGRVSLTIEIQLHEELIDRSFAYLWHFSMVREKEMRKNGELDFTTAESWKMLKHRKQKQIFREIQAYVQTEFSTVLRRIWQGRAEQFYASADFDGLLDLRRKIETHRYPKAEYLTLLKERHSAMQHEIAQMREAAQRIRSQARFFPSHLRSQ